jgi:hypothetical protein
VTRAGATPRRFSAALAEHLLALSGFAIAGVALTWPLARDFSTRLIGEVDFDIRHAIWVMWHAREAALGDATWPWTTLLHFPYGMSVLVDGVGPINALLAWPFWPWGAAAAFNGAALSGCALSGWMLYLLARHIGLDRGTSFWAGVLFMAWPIHLIAVFGHLEKLFIGLLPLTVLAGSVALDLRRRPGWVAAPAFTLLATLLQNGNQFVFAMLALGLLMAAALYRADAAARRAQAVRIALVVAASVIVCGPMLGAIVQTMRHPWMLVTLGDFSPHYQPDLLQLLAPAPHQAIARPLYPDDTPLADFARASSMPVLSARPGWYGSGMETAVNVPVAVLLLIVAAVVLRARGAAAWLGFGLLFAVLSLGPHLRAFGTSWRWLKLPYYLLMQVPGLNVMRVPGRFMLAGAIGFVLSAALGAAALRARPGRVPRWLAAGVMVVALVECWPRVWPQNALPPVPAFYAGLEGDEGTFAVLDLPHAWHGHSQPGSAYQYFQTRHRKPIAWAYLSRFYIRFPLNGLDSLWNANLTDHRATRARLRDLGYRYVVWHKHPELFGGGRVDRGYDGVPRAAPTPASSNAFIRGAFEGEAPVLDDELTTVYRVE